MDREAFLQILTPLDVHDTYRELYFRNPAAFAVPVRSWEEFCGRYNELEGEGKTKLPPVPPTPIACFFGGGVFSAGGLGRGERDCKRPLLPGFSA